MVRFLNSLVHANGLLRNRRRLGLVDRLSGAPEFDKALKMSEFLCKVYELDGSPAVHTAKECRDELEEGDDGMLDFLIKDSTKRRNAWDALALLSKHFLTIGSPLPDALAEWAADVLQDQLRSENKLRQRPILNDNLEKRELGNRDRFIMAAMIVLVDLDGMTATRSDATANTHSAADAVAQAFGESFENIKRIWNRENRSGAYKERREHLRKATETGDQDYLVNVLASLL